jgi:hypothetical protein
MNIHDATRIILIGTGATLVSDLWGLARAPLFGMPAPDYGMVGRWIGHMTRGRFRHERIAAAPAISDERALGWIAHYAIGIGFAVLLCAVAGPAWLRNPALAPALLVGIATVAAPFLVMQPGMGAGFFASRTARPFIARMHSLALHAAFGVGLYLSGRLMNHPAIFN